MDDLKIFDENGNKLELADVIARFLKDESKKLETAYDRVYIGIEYSETEHKDMLWITLHSGFPLQGFDFNDL